MQLIETIYVLTIFSVKKIVVFLTLLFCATSILAKEYSGAKKIREFYNSETKHEIGVGIGWMTFTNLLNFPGWDSEDDFTPIDKEYSYTPAYNIHYYYKLHRRVKLGMDITWQKNKTNSVFSTDIFNANVDRFTQKHDEELLEGYLMQYDSWQKECGTTTYNHLIFAPQVKLTWLSRGHFAIYQRYGIGLDLEFSKNQNEEKDRRVCPTPCAALLGLEFGGGKFRGYFETLELSAQGLFHGGIKFDF